MQHDQNIKGVTLLELLVTIAIVAIISGVAYPNFSKWKKDRDVAQATERIANILKSLTTQSQRGSYPFVQLYICEGGKCSDPAASGNLRFYGRGLYKERFIEIQNSGGLLTCDLESDNWEEPSGNHLISFFGTDDVAIQFAGDDSGVCFSGDGRYYAVNGELTNNQDIKVPTDRDTNNYILICHINDAAADGTCPVDYDGGLEQPAYLIEWSRFGNIIKYKYTIRDEEGFWTQK